MNLHFIGLELRKEKALFCGYIVCAVGVDKLGGVWDPERGAWGAINQLSSPAPLCYDPGENNGERYARITNP